MPFGEYALGFVLLAVTFTGCGGTTWLVLQRRCAHIRGAARWSAGGLLLSTALLGVHIIPLTLGVLSRGTVVGTAMLLVALAWFGLSPAPADHEKGPESPGSSLASWVVAGAALAAIVAYVIAFGVDRATVPVEGVDALAFHLPQSARWIQSGSLWHVDTLVPGWAFGNYPNNGDVFQLAVILPWDNDALVRFVSYPFLVLSAVSIYATAIEIGAPRAASVTVAVLAASLPASLATALHSPLTDTVMHATFACGLLFVTRHARTRARADLLLGALGFGLALGTKWYGLSSVAAVAVVWVAARLVAERSLRAISRDALVAGAVIAASGGIWLLRNLVLSGNPVFAVKVAPLGVTIFDAPPDPIRESIGFALTHYLGDPGIWDRVIIPQLLDSFGWAGGLFLLSAVASLALGFRGPHRDGRATTLAIAALVVVAVYAATPYSAYGADGEPVLRVAARYGIPAVVLAAPLAARLIGRLGRAGIALELVGLALIADAIARYDAFGGVTLTLRASRPFLAAGVGIALLAFAGFLVPRAPWRHVPDRWRAAAGVSLASVLVVVVGLVGHRQQQSYNARRYIDIDAAYTRLAQDTGGGRRVGLSGFWPSDNHPPPWIAFGPRLDNEVQYVGPVIEGRLEQFEEEGPYRAALRLGNYDYVLVGLVSITGGPIPELAWTEAEGYVEVARSERVALLRRD